jgi:20S proteasome alpha/beta subunit
MNLFLKYIIITVKFKEPEELFEVLSQCLLAAMDRDALSGWGAIVHIM